MKAPLTLFILIACLVSPAFVPAFTLTKWEPNGTPVSTEPKNQELTDCISDGAGGVIMVWTDTRDGIFHDIYIQRVNAYGVMLWTTGGLAVCTAAGSQVRAGLVSDGAGGAIVAWEDARSGAGDIYAQRVNASGVVQWTPDGVPVCTAADTQSFPSIASDGSGGAVIAWVDYRNAVDYNLYAQRINGAGVAQWTAGGTPICTEPSNQVRIWITPDGTGGVIAYWADMRGGPWGLYSQRVDGSGAVQWTADGITLRTNMPNVNEGGVVPDGAGGAVIAWAEWVNASYMQVRAQRIDALGALQWSTDGVIMCPFSSASQMRPDIASDGVGGAIIAWDDFRSGADSDVYAQRVSVAGALQWDGSGVALCTAPGNQLQPLVASDGSGGAVVAWRDDRSGMADIFAQRVSALGAIRWGGDGEVVCAAYGWQADHALAADGTGGAIVAWTDLRTDMSNDVYAQRVEGRYGYWGHPEPLLSTVTDVPADQGGKVRVNWFPSSRDILNEQFISHYSVWRAASAAAAAAAVESGVPNVRLTDVGDAFDGPAIREETTASGASAFWELVGTQDAVYLEAYSLTVPTGYDSSAAGPATHDFQVIAHGYWSQYLNWPSNVASGHSVDNLSPPPPLYLTAQRAGNDINLKWNRVRVKDLRDYAVYRATAAGVTPVPMNFLSSSTDSTLTDTGAPLTTLYYVVTAYDVHANQSAPSNEATVVGATGVGDTPAITQLTVLQNYPNPFSAQTEFRVGLPAPSDVRVEIYDVAGRRVGSLEVLDAAAGWQRIPFAGRNDAGTPLASGVYFCRVTANGSTVTRKMVIAR
ncbi:MAG: T9SS type A sorting domain-containing protein [Candidatus Krumholzibacteria bacterium]|nr:T9SS type A sorting domain-containing protein [Candidatus Krumholzibacteria bacterium]MDH4338549.1 T9SS type A sorting domain-containing protein [Candidatus Krumholzibacteria bacterium]